MENEKVLGYVDNLTAFGIIAPIRKSLVITDKRLLLLDASSVNATGASAGFAAAFGIFGRGMANRVSKDEVRQTTERLAQSNLDDLIKSNKDNVALDLSSVKGVEITRGRIEIKTDQKTFGYGLSNPDTSKKESGVYENYVQVLKAALGDRVTASA